MYMDSLWSTGAAFGGLQYYLKGENRSSTKSCSLDPYHSHVSTPANAPSHSDVPFLTQPQCATLPCKVVSEHPCGTVQPPATLSELSAPGPSAHAWALSKGLMLWRWNVSALRVCQHRERSAQSWSLPRAPQTDLQQFLWAQWDCCTYLRHMRS